MRKGKNLMDIETIVLLVVSAAALVMAGVGIYAVGKPTNVTGVLEATNTALTDIERTAGAAKEYVLAAEQLWKTGRLEKGNRLYFAVERLVKLFPEIPAETLEDSVEAAVAWMKMSEGKLLKSVGEN